MVIHPAFKEQWSIRDQGVWLRALVQPGESMRAAREEETEAPKAREGKGVEGRSDFRDRGKGNRT